jgi:CubicO group peptidase (beta-lactamase class C family)
METASAKDAGLDVRLLEQAASVVPDQYAHLTSVLIARGGRLVWEHYFGECDASTEHYVASVTKSVVSVVVGIARGAGLFPSLEAPLTEVFPEASGAFARTRIEHLLTMTAGIEFKRAGPAPQSLPSPARHSVEHLLAQASQVKEPGSEFFYEDAVSRLVSAAVSRSTGENCLDFGTRMLFEPLGLRRPRWPSDAADHSQGAGGVWWTPREMLAFGELMLRRGSHQGRQLVPEQWVDLSTRRHSDGGPPAQLGYGYLWWIEPFGIRASFCAAGFGGQLVACLPSLDAVIVTTGDTRQPRNSLPFLASHVLPAFS